MKRVAGMFLMLTALALPAASQPAVRAAPGAAGMTEQGLWNPLRPGRDNQPITVKVLVLNYDPSVPSEGNRRLTEVFRFNNPAELAGRYKAALEYASGGYLRFDVVEWRNLNEIYAQKGGHRYSIEEYVRNRRTGKGWRENAEADYPRLLREQGVAPLIDAGKVDEVWIFSDHFFGLWEASMAGPGAFFINGGVYPEVPTRRPFAFYGFNYERGVAEMLHNTSHRTEATLNRAYGEWDLKNPRNNWERFSANDRQSGGAAGVGTCHWPPNAEKDYDYGNERVVLSWADDFLDYPNLPLRRRPVSRATWSPTGKDPHQGYMKWYFAHLPRAAGVNPDGRMNNWWKYLYDFQNYGKDGKPLPPTAQMLAAEILSAKAPLELTVVFQSPYPLDPATLDQETLRVTGPKGARLKAEPVLTDAAPGRPYAGITFRIPAPARGWTGEYRVDLREGKAVDGLGRPFPAGKLGVVEWRGGFFPQRSPFIDGDSRGLLGTLAPVRDLLPDADTVRLQIDFTEAVPARATVGLGDIRVVGPAGYQQFAVPGKIQPDAKGAIRRVEYTVSREGAAWVPGLYQVELKGYQLADEQGHFAPEQASGTFRVKAPRGPHRKN